MEATRAIGEEDGSSDAAPPLIGYGGSCGGVAAKKSGGGGGGGACGNHVSAIGSGSCATLVGDDFASLSCSNATSQS